MFARFPLATAAGVLRLWPAALVSLALSACQSAQDTTSLELAAAKVNQKLTVTGGGTGGGVVTAPAYGETAELACVITNGSSGPENCTRSYGWKTVVTLSVVADPGSRFTGWSGACTGTALTCKLTMSQSRSVKASFAGSSAPTYTLNVTGSGTGSGTIASQSGLTPAINCAISAGTAVSGACTATYPQGTSVTLTASPSGGHSFDGWGGDCTGTGGCALTMDANRAAAAGFTAPAGIEASVGHWDAPEFNPVIGMNVTHLFNGKFLLWGHSGEPQLWDPVGGFTQVTDATCTNPQACELFCAGHAFLPDGSLLVAGGHNEALGDDNGLTQASIFDGVGWRATGSMRYARWYPTLVTMFDGRVVALSGDQAPGNVATIPERYGAGVWAPLTSAARKLALYPRAFVEPKNGRIFVAGQESPSMFLNPLGTGGWTTGPSRVVATRDYGAAVMLNNTVVYFGGGGGNNCPGNLPNRTAEKVDLGAATPAWQAIAPMAIGRRMLNATILADGTVLVTGGSSQCGFTNEAGAVFAAERWDPSAGSNGQGAWTTMANASVVRVYHSTAVLMADGRVLSTGSGEGSNTTPQNTYEIYSPPYLYQGVRPSYALATNRVGYGGTFTVTTPDAASIRKVHIIRLASTTHAFDMGQRLRSLSYQVGTDGQTLTVTEPASGNLAPPGPYMLFLVNLAGVPSVGQIVLVGD
ncbi:MAG TPA: galactose oxidase-like domain-containing protein [Gemmatimonadales bacterium]|nr:galactose oxidase-like domain-containing protein [Gemmatimonadales bacterium]